MARSDVVTPVPAENDVEFVQVVKLVLMNLTHPFTMKLMALLLKMILEEGMIVICPVQMMTIMDILSVTVVIV